LNGRPGFFSQIFVILNLRKISPLKLFLEQFKILQVSDIATSQFVIL